MEEFDKSEAATPYKLQQARRRGSVARSPDLTGAVALLTAAAALYAWSWDALQSLMALGRASLVQGLSMEVTAASMVSLIGHVGAEALRIIAPFALAVGAAALVASLAQTGLVWSGFPLKPDLTRINPVTGLKRLFSMRTIYDAFKSVIKVSILAWVLYLIVRDLEPALYRLGERTPFEALRQLMSMLASMSLKLAFVALLLALLDLGYTRFEFKRKMRMSRRDVKDEVKHREGDPRVRSRLRGLRAEMLQKSASVRQVGQADVLIVNPTHLAVALEYKRGEMAAPVMLAKGAGSLAARMRSEASRCGVTIVRNPVLARALYFQGEMGQTIPTALYADVARIMVWLLAQRNARAALLGAK
ncbi:flagellar biosynthetic protein FlhB [Achromobacter deleyi]|uniref:EscU/YscU/HrcU family type III secretion system export apparatus switch protein n=1 Tax=Achromobacter deleyi TaxID=1353891 RepID=UPI002866B492|nr:EscU/YscU/HrcU family type III secretion system export apparatus switch protein [Achromobacter deleyi]MDR6602123.1 flagellar biosynthetic protein FlhB [Achromobacter deleyi]